MKYLITISFALALFTLSLNAQGIGGLLNKVTKKDTSGNSILNQIQKNIPGNSSKSGLSNDDIISGLKEALRVGTDSTTQNYVRSMVFLKIRQ